MSLKNRTSRLSGTGFFDNFAINVFLRMSRFRSLFLGVTFPLNTKLMS